MKEKIKPNYIIFDEIKDFDEAALHALAEAFKYLSRKRPFPNTKLRNFNGGKEINKEAATQAPQKA